MCKTAMANEKFRYTNTVRMHCLWNGNKNVILIIVLNTEGMSVKGHFLSVL
jgi:hypothetical protein